MFGKDSIESHIHVFNGLLIEIAETIDFDRGNMCKKKKMLKKCDRI